MDAGTPTVRYKESYVFKCLLAFFAIAIFTMTADAQDKPLFGTAGQLQDELEFDPPRLEDLETSLTGEDAAKLCSRSVTSKFGHRPLDTRKISSAGTGKYLIEGTAEANSGAELIYYCRVVHGEVVVLHLNTGKGENAHGAGLLGVQLAGLKTNAPPKHVVRHPAHPTGANPRHDLKFIRKACRHELRRHLAYDPNGPAANDSQHAGYRGQYDGHRPSWRRHQ